VPWGCRGFTIASRAGHPSLAGSTPMNLADGIRKHGFRKWYERELLQSHAHMVLAFVCLVVAFAAFELMHDGGNSVDNVAAIVVATAVGTWAVRRYIALLGSAEAAANQADCPGCGTYARFTLVREPEQGQVHVACKQCSREWLIDGS
jgi:hypothetical protein